MNLAVLPRPACREATIGEQRDAGTARFFEGTYSMLTFLICTLAGLFAGIGTGLSGLSAAAVISPMLMAFLGFDPYEAVGIALASDVLASAVSAYIYGKNKNLDIRGGVAMLLSVLVFTAVGSFFASLISSEMLGTCSVFVTFVLGLKFILRPVMRTKEIMKKTSGAIHLLKSVVGGAAIGLVCGFVGAGGGMMMLIVLTSVLGYELKTAVGTSVFIMTFTALTGAVSHFAIVGGISSPVELLICMIFTFIGARVSSLFANRESPRVLNRATGMVLTLLGAIMIGIYFLK